MKSFAKIVVIVLLGIAMMFTTGCKKVREYETIASETYSTTYHYA